MFARNAESFGDGISGGRISDSFNCACLADLVSLEGSDRHTDETDRRADDLRSLSFAASCLSVCCRLPDLLPNPSQRCAVLLRSFLLVASSILITASPFSFMMGSFRAFLAARHHHSDKRRRVSKQTGQRHCKLPFVLSISHLGKHKAEKGK